VQRGGCGLLHAGRRTGDALSVATPLPGRPYQTSPGGPAATSSHIARRGLGGFSSPRPWGQTDTPPGGTLPPRGSSSPRPCAGPWQRGEEATCPHRSLSTLCVIPICRRTPARPRCPRRPRRCCGGVTSWAAGHVAVSTRCPGSWARRGAAGHIPPRHSSRASGQAPPPSHGLQVTGNN